MEIVKNSKKEIVKSNNLIESSYKLTTGEQRLIYLASTKLSKIMLNKELSIEEVQDLIEQARFDLIDIDVIEFKKDFNIKSKNIYGELEKTAERLFDRRIIYIDGKTIVKKRWVITCRYNKEKGSVSLQFHPDLVRDLLVFKNRYTIFQYEYAKNIKSNYAVRIYELLKQYESFGNRDFTINEFRFKLGIDDTEYPQYASLKQKIISPVIKQLNEVSDLYVEFEEVKVKRKVEKIKFIYCPKKVMIKEGKIKSKQEQLSFWNDEEIAITNNYDVVEEFNNILGITITPNQAEQLIDFATQNIEDRDLKVDITTYIRDRKSVADKYVKRKGIKDSYLSIIFSAVKDYWTLDKTKNIDDFNNYEQRKYTDEEFDNIEKMLREKGLS
jgi:plasmid replication initiation protein